MFLAAIKQPVSQHTLANRQFRSGHARDRIEAVRAVRREYQCAQLATQKRRRALPRTEGGAEAGQAGQGPSQHTIRTVFWGNEKGVKFLHLLLCTVPRSTLSFLIEDLTNVRHVLVPKFPLKIFDMSHFQLTIDVYGRLHYVFFLAWVEVTDKTKYVTGGSQKFYSEEPGRYFSQVRPPRWVGERE